MKKLLLLVFVVFAVKTNAQTEEQKNLAKAVNITGGGTFFKPKIMKELNALALAQVMVDFKNISSKSITEREKKRTLFGKAPGKAATATVTSYLETTDGDLQPKDYQEIVDHFYAYFQEHLSKNGLKTSSWADVTNEEFYKDAEDKKDEDRAEEEKGNSWVTYIANNGKELYNGEGGFGFMKLKKIGKMSESLNAPVAFIYAVVDFAEIDVAVNVNTSGYKSSWTPGSSQTTTMKSQTSVSAYMKTSGFGESFRNSLVIDEKLRAENLQLNQALPAEMDYATALTEDPSRMKKKSKLFSVSLSKKMESAPVIISTTISNYKAAAKKALERYADAIIAKAIVMKSE
ncbi:MAG: hypothetical protein JST10_09390 [Bacteroidetes bacterium]|nr:hypothetical protein [Bacteroidota bacterium]MBS1632773.1 hypothetical protein [Bacteroidota bacterium]